MGKKERGRRDQPVKVKRSGVGSYSETVPPSYLYRDNDLNAVFLGKTKSEGDVNQQDQN